MKIEKLERVFVYLNIILGVSILGTLWVVVEAIHYIFWDNPFNWWSVVFALILWVASIVLGFVYLKGVQRRASINQLLGMTNDLAESLGEEKPFTEGVKDPDRLGEVITTIFDMESKKINFKNQDND